MSEHLGPYAPEGASCDVCGSGGKRCIVEPESGAYVCEDCQAFHERAIEAAAQALDPMAFGDRPASNALDIQRRRTKARTTAQTAVKAYLEFADEPITQEVD